MTDLSAYYSGGYFLLRRNHPCWPQLDEDDLLPEKLISLSTCICPRLNMSSVFNFGVPESKFAKFDLWHTSYYGENEGAFSGFYSTVDARHFIQRFLPDTTDLLIVSVGLPHQLEAENWREESSDAGDNFEYGIEKQIARHFPLEDGGTTLGFDVVSYEYGDFGHSWICSYLQHDMHDLFDIRPNEHGLLATHDDAEKVYNWIAEDKMEGKRAEPAPYDFWLLVSYPLASSE